MTLTGTKKKHTKHWGQQCYPQLFGYLLGVDPVQGSQGIQSIIQLYSQRLKLFFFLLAKRRSIPNPNMPRTAETSAKP